MSTLLNTSAIHPLGRVDYWTGGIAEHFFEGLDEGVASRADYHSRYQR